MTSPWTSADPARTRPTIALVAAALPPAWDGIGDYTGALAAELAGGPHGVGAITVLTGDAVAALAAPIPLVTICGVFDPNVPATADRLLDKIAADRPDWVVLQYNPFSYGRRGYNLCLPRAMARVRDRSPGTRLAIMYHETYVPVENWKFAVMTTWQRYQFWRLGRAADTLLFSTHRWAEVHRPWFRDKPVFHLPVGSNVPREPITSSQARSRLGIADDEVVLGVFGTAHVSRLFTTLNAAARAVQAAGRRVRVLYVGPGGAVVRASLDADIPLIADGPLPADEVSRRLSSMDIALSTYTDGVSTRRGAMMAALQHGIAVVGTRGVGTDPELLAENGRGLSLWPVGDDASLAAAVVRLAGDEVERARLAAAGLALFENRYAWPVVARRLLACLGGQSESPRMA